MTNSRASRVVAGIVLWSVVAPAPAWEGPELVGRWPYGPAYTVSVSQDLVLYGCGCVLMLADVSVPSAPEVVGELPLPGLIEAVAVAGSYAYVANGPGGVRVIDVSMPSAPVEVGYGQTGGDARDVVVSGNHALIADSAAGLRVIDVSVPAAPLEVGFLAAWSARAVEVSEGYAYLIWRSEVPLNSGMLAIDVSVPASPSVTWILELLGGDGFTAVAVAADHVFATRDLSLDVFDLTTPSAPAPGW